MSDILDSVQQFYDEAGEYFSKTRSKTYGETGNFNWAELNPHLKMLKDRDKILDLGCGNGRLLTGIDSKVNYLGIDFSKTLVNEARRAHRGKKFAVKDITKPGTYRGLGKFDAIFCIATLHHLPRREQQLFVLSKIKKHLIKGGFAVITVWNLLQDRYHLQHLRNLPMKIHNLRWITIPFANKWDRFCFTFDKYYMAGLLEEAGLDVQDLYYAGKGGKRVGAIKGRNLVAVVKNI